jgi:hypothetical protein
MIILAWILLVVGLAGMAAVVCISASNKRHQRRLEQMRDEADRKRDCYFVLSGKTDAKPEEPRPRARFLP